MVAVAGLRITSQKFKAEAFPETWTLGVRTPKGYYGLSTDHYPDQWESVLVWNSPQSVPVPDGIRTGSSLPWNFLFPEIVRGTPRLRLVRRPQYAMGTRPQPLVYPLMNLVGDAEALVCLEFRDGSDIYEELCLGNSSITRVAPNGRLFWQFECRGEEVATILQKNKLL